MKNKYLAYKLVFTATLVSIGLLLPQSIAAARYYFHPPTGSLSANCPDFTVDVMVDTEGEASNAADVEIAYNPAQVTLVDANPILSGIQIIPGTAYESYRGNLVTGNKVRLTGNSAIQNLVGIGTFAQLKFSRNQGVFATNFDFYFTGAGQSLDSNVAKASTSTDLLSSVTNANYTFTNIICPTAIPTDSTAPIITLVQPADLSAQVPLDTNIIIHVQDATSSIDLNKLEIKIGGQTYTVHSPGVAVTGGGQNYQITLDPASDLPAATLITLQVSIADDKGNKSIEIFQFNAPVPSQLDTTTPVITLVAPAEGATNVDLGTAVQLQIRDLGAGVDISTLSVVIAEQTYTYTDTEVQVTGTKEDYVVRIQPRSILPAGTPIRIQVSVSDNSGNVGLEQFIFNTFSTPQQAIDTLLRDPLETLRTIFAISPGSFRGTILEGTFIETYTMEYGAVSTGSILITILLLLSLLLFTHFLTSLVMIIPLMNTLLQREQHTLTWGLVLANSRKHLHRWQRVIITHLFLAGFLLSFLAYSLYPTDHHSAIIAIYCVILGGWMISKLLGVIRLR